MTRPPAVCFVSPGALPSLLDSAHGGLGGAELQQAMLGRELARRGHRVTFIVGDMNGHEAPASAAAGRVDGLELIIVPWEPRGRAPAEGALTRGVRFARETRWLWRAMKRSAADIYTVRSNHLIAAMTGAWCAARGRPFVFSSGHDGNCDLDRAHRRPRRAVALAYAAALRGAAAVVVQTEPQRVLMRDRFEVTAEMIPNAAAAQHVAPAGGRAGVLWVGSMEPRKGPDRLLEVASRLPGVDFTMVGGRGDHPVFYEEIRRRVRRSRNVVYRGPLGRAETLAEFSRCAVYMNTSRSEGFPNTFLDAWLTGTPVVSLDIDPDGPGGLGRLGAGMVVGGERTSAAILDLLGDPRRRDEMGRAGRRHALTRHALPAVADRWQALFDHAARGTLVR